MTENGFKQVKADSPEEKQLLAYGWYIHEKDDTTTILHKGRRRTDRSEPVYTFDDGRKFVGLHPDQVTEARLTLEYYGGYSGPGGDDAMAHALFRALAWAEEQRRADRAREIVREIQAETGPRVQKHLDGER